MKYTFKLFQAEYPNDAACLDKILEIRHGGNQFQCPACGKDSKFHRIAKRRAFACQHCGHHVYPCAGTPFEKSRTPLTNWFFAMYLMTSTRHGVAAKELERQLGCTYKTAWRMAHELRKHMANADSRDQLSGHVEIDEAYIGGKRKAEPGKRGRGTPGKTIVFGMVERDGKLRAGPVKDVRRWTLDPIVRKNVKEGSTVTTDELGSYNDLWMAYAHGRVKHSIKQYAVGIHHTNTVEGVWSHLKRGIRGTHVHVSPKHLWKYVSEFAYRYNMRKDHGAMFDRLISSLSLPRLADG